MSVWLFSNYYTEYNFIDYVSTIKIQKVKNMNDIYTRFPLKFQKKKAREKNKKLSAREGVREKLN